MGQIEDDIKGKNGIFRGYKIKTRNGYTGRRLLQLICDLEIGGSCKTSSQGNEMERDNNHIDSSETDAKERRIGASRLSKINARNRIAGIYKEEEENEDDD